MPYKGSHCCKYKEERNIFALKVTDEKVHDERKVMSKVD
jgi:hypothetical protein